MSAKTRKVYLLYQYYRWDRTEKRKRTPENRRHRQEKSSPDDPRPVIALCAHTRNAAYRKLPEKIGENLMKNAKSAVFLEIKRKNALKFGKLVQSFRKIREIWNGAKEKT